jgi:hypothetical protein
MSLRPTILPAIIQKILEQAKREREEADELHRRRQQEEQLGRTNKQRAFAEREKEHEEYVAAIKSSLWGTEQRKVISLVVVVSATCAIAFYGWNYQNKDHALKTGGSLAADAVREAFVKFIGTRNLDNIKPRRTTVSGSYALQSWGGDVTGGAALLRYDRASNKWLIVETGGGAWSHSELVKMGVPQATATDLMEGQ